MPKNIKKKKKIKEEKLPLEIMLQQISDELDKGKETPKIEKYNPNELISNISGYNELNEALHSDVNMIEVFNKMAEMAKFASHHMIEFVTENEGAFNKSIVEGHAKELKKLSEDLYEISVNAKEFTDKGRSLAEDIGKRLDTYYTINDMVKEEEMVENVDEDLEEEIDEKCDKKHKKENVDEEKEIEEEIDEMFSFQKRLQRQSNLYDTSSKLNLTKTEVK